MGGACVVCVFTLNHSALNASLRRLSVGICPLKRHVFFPVWEFSCHPHAHAPTWRRLPFWRHDASHAFWTMQRRNSEVRINEQSGISVTGIKRRG